MKHIILGSGLLSLFLIAAGPARAADPDEEDLVEPVRKAIERGVMYLRSQQHNGDWEHRGYPPHSGGVTALVLLALLNSGAIVDDPLIQAGLTSLRRVEPDSVYVVSLQTMVYALAKRPVDKERIQKNVEWLIKARVFEDGKFAGWGYKSGSGSADNSNTQYALLALHEGHLAGAKVDDGVWESILQFYKSTQRGDGSWKYKSIVREPSPTMTTAGLCGLLIASNDMRSSRKECKPEKCGEYDEDRNINKALHWVAATMLPNGRIENHNHLYYYLYGLERAGRFS